MHEKTNSRHLNTIGGLATIQSQDQNQIALTAPGRPGLIYSDFRRQLQTSIDRLHLTGIGRKDRVAILLPNGPELAMALLAVSSCAVSVPLNPTYTQAELYYFLSQVNAKAIIVSSETAYLARDLAIANDIIFVEVQSDAMSPSGVFEFHCKPSTLSTDTTLPSPEDSALLLFTSGTTSQPKLVPLTHFNLLSSVDTIVNTLQLTERDCCLNILPLFHIHGIVAALLATLVSEGSVVCTPGFQDAKFFQWLEEFNPSWYTAVPTMHQAILARATGQTRTIDGTSLRFIRSSSAHLPSSVMQELHQVFGVPVIEAYGMTEASHQITSNLLPPGKRKLGSVGIATETQVAILDTANNVLPPDQVGEIAIRGSAVTSGYENNAEKNAEAFTDGWFRTGDQGRIDSDGYLYLTGRLSDVINRGGMMISPIEVDEVLMRHPGIKSAAAFAVPHPTLEQDLVAAVVIHEQQNLTESQIREFAMSRLVDFKVPSRVVIVTELPTSGTGKISRTDLANKLRHFLSSDYAEPSNAIEALVADIYREVLALEQVGVCDNFFLLGGDSLSAGRVISRLDNLLQVKIPMSMLFEKPTVVELAFEIKSMIENQGNYDLIEILTEFESYTDDDIHALLSAETRNA